MTLYIMPSRYSLSRRVCGTTILLFVALLLGRSIDIRAQPSDGDSLRSRSERIADSLVRANPELFGDTIRTLRVPPWMLHSPLRMSLPVAFVPEPRDLLATTEPRTLPGYNRADGLVIGIGAPRPIPLVDSPRLLGDGGIAYAFGSHYWQGRAAITLELGESAGPRPVRLLLEGHHITDTRDSWRSSDFENSLAAAIAGVDHRDYFQRSGFSVGLRWFPENSVSLYAEGLRDNYRTLRAAAAWSLFGPDNPFDPQPNVREGVMQSARFGIMLDHLEAYDVHPATTTELRRTSTRWAFESSIEFGKMESFGGAAPLSFVHFVADGVIRTPIAGEGLRLALHLRTGLASDLAPRQRLFTIGGIGALAAWPHNTEIGERSILLESDLLFTFCRGCRSAILRELTLIVSNDIGGAWSGSSSNANDPLPPELNTLLYGPAVYIGTFNGDIRVGYAIRTDGSGSGRWVVRLR